MANDSDGAQRFRNRDWKCSELRRLGRAVIPGSFLGRFGWLEKPGEGLFLSLRSSAAKGSPVALVKTQKGIELAEERSVLRENAL
jgi:hypothetical protein